MNEPGGLELPPSGAMVDDEAVSFAITVIERSGAATRLENALAKSTGRERSVSVQALLVALLCLAMDDRPLLLTSVTDVLYRRLSARARALLSITGTVTDRRGVLARYRCVRYCFHAICSTVDPSPLRKNRCLADDELAETSKEMTAEEITAARARLEAMVNALIEASVSVLSDEERSAHDGAVGLDATPVPLFSPGRVQAHRAMRVGP